MYQEKKGLGVLWKTVMLIFDYFLTIYRPDNEMVDGTIFFFENNELN